jgi:hypothetical protein
MGCRLTDFNIESEAQTLVINGHSVEIANATTKGLKVSGVVYKVNGKFQGFTGSADAARYWAEKNHPPRQSTTSKRTITTV